MPRKNVIYCLHGCGVKLELKPKTGAYECSKCGCVFRVVVCRWTPKCFAEKHPNYGSEVVTLKEIQKKKRKRRKK